MVCAHFESFTALLLCDFLPSLNDVYLQQNETLDIFISSAKKGQVYLQQNEKKEETKGKNCQVKTMWSLEKPI